MTQLKQTISVSENRYSNLLNSNVTGRHFFYFFINFKINSFFNSKDDKNKSENLLENNEILNLKTENGKLKKQLAEFKEKNKNLESFALNLVQKITKMNEIKVKSKETNINKLNNDVDIGNLQNEKFMDSQLIQKKIKDHLKNLEINLDTLEIKMQALLECCEENLIAKSKTCL